MGIFKISGVDSLWEAPNKKKNVWTKVKML